jgi:hypothetical protein
MRIPRFRSRLLALALAAATAPAAAQEQEPLAVLPFWSPSNLIVFRGSIGDADSLLVLLLDSGAGRSVVDAPLVDSFGLRVTGQGQAVGAAGRAPVRILGETTMHLGEYVGLPQGSVDLTVPMPVSIDFAELEPALGWNLDAVVGHELFARYVVQIDYAAGLVRVYDPATFTAPADPWVPVVVRESSAFVPVQVSVDGRTIRAELRLDTGSASALTFNAPFVRAHGLAAGPGLTAGASWGVGGRSMEVTRMLQGATLGEFALDAPAATLSLDTAGVLSGADGDGLLGGDVLGRFTVTLDYGRGRMYLRPNARFGEPFRRGLSGMGIFAVPPEFRAYRITHVDPGSPAAAAGLQADDVIETVDGRPAGEMPLDYLRDLFKLPGAAYTLTVRRGGEAHTLRLQLPD